MERRFDHAAIEKKWRARQEQEKLYVTDVSTAKDTYYALDMFPYPSSDAGLHVGHWRGYVLSDFYARYAMLNGKTVLHPMGFDSFGLPAENAAIKHKSQPKKFTDQAIKAIRPQLEQMGSAFDWTKYLSTSDPSYYKWTQWLFLQFFKHGLAEKRLSLVNWCPKDQTVLANEQVINGCCERCGTGVTKKELSQWFIKATDFAQELLDGLTIVDWPERVKTLQREWIGRSEGATVIFDTNAGPIEVFTTRVDTIYGVTALVLAPEHPLVVNLTADPQKSAVSQYVKEIMSKTDVIRQQNWDKEKSAVFTGQYAKHPLTGEDVPIWIADYVLMSYGTGAVMSVPAHDERDFAFATKYKLPIVPVIKSATENIRSSELGILENSDIFTGLLSEDAAKKITSELTKKGLGKKTTIYRLRDWLVSRQRYWGPPIPIVYDPNGKAHALKDEHLPLLLPEDVDFLPGGESPITRSQEFIARAEKLYGAGWRFETDTLDTFVDSSWYFMRYLTPNDDTQAFDPELIKKWLPVDLYVGGIEHATLHLLYARLIVRFLSTYGYIDPKITEPFKELFSIGSITMHGAKMSKSKGNVVSPDLLVEHYGTDALRGYELFIGPLDVEADWTNHGINGIHRFLIKLYQLANKPITEAKNSQAETALNLYLQKITPMIAQYRLNTMIAEAMKFASGTLVNGASKKVWEQFIITMSPIFPYLSEEVWSILGNNESIFKARWPNTTAVTQANELTVLINQKFVAIIALPSGIVSEAEAVKLAEANVAVKKKLAGVTRKAIVYRSNKLLNIIVGG